MGEAYAALGARERALLKTCIARLHRIWGESPERAFSRVEHRAFCLEREERPAETAVFVCAASYPHPAALLAAIMPAVLAGAARILPLFVASAAGAAVSPPLLAALELAGVERAFLPDEQSALDALRLLRPERLVLLGDDPFCGRLAALARELDLVFRSFSRGPRYYSERLGRTALLRFPADPRAEEAAAPKRQDGQGGRDGNAREADGANGRKPRLSLDADHEHLWIWPDFEPSWFRLSRLRLFRP